MEEKKDRNPDPDKQFRPADSKAGAGESRVPEAPQSGASAPVPEPEPPGFDAPVVMWEEEESTPPEGAEEEAGRESGETAEPAPFHEISAFLSQQLTGEETTAAPSEKSTDAAQPATEQAQSGSGPVPASDSSGATGSPASPGEATPPESLALSQQGSSDFYKPMTSHEENFFDIPDEIPLLQGEDTEESPVLLEKKERIRKRSSPLWLVTNVVSWSLLLLFGAIVVYCLLYYRYASERLRGGAGSEKVENVDVVIKPGESFNEILKELRRKNLLGSYLWIDDKYLMKYLAKVNGDSEKIKAGFYRFNTSMGLSEIYEKLGQGSHDFKLMIPEGITCREIAAAAKRKNKEFDEKNFLKLVKDPVFIAKLEPYIGKLQEPSLEGYLYPNTYSYGPGMKEEELIRMMVKTFRDTVDAKLEGVVRHDSFNFHQHLTMASLIEREARIDTDRPLIASVIFNRLEKGMPLQIDASVLYALEDWKHDLTHEDLKMDSPYNTYKVKGLPPGPICNPRVTSILATYEPAKTRFLFYVYKGDGSHAFAETFEQHKRNVQLYRKSHPSLILQPETAVIAPPTPGPAKTASATPSVTPAPVSTATSISQVQAGAKETTSVSQTKPVTDGPASGETKPAAKSPAAEESPVAKRKESREKTPAAEKTKTSGNKTSKRSGTGRKGTKSTQ